jgi:hypothetical protein
MLPYQMPTRPMSVEGLAMDVLLFVGRRGGVIALIRARPPGWLPNRRHPGTVEFVTRFVGLLLLT